MPKLFSLKKKNTANKDLATLIDDDLKQESTLLQKLIQEVVEANQQVKDSHQRRVEETEERLAILNAEISRLKDEIDQEENKDTTSFTKVFETKAKVYDHLDTIRHSILTLYTTNPLSKSLTTFKEELLEFTTETLTPIDKEAIQYVHELQSNLSEHAHFIANDADALNESLNIDLKSFETAVTEKTLAFNKQVVTFHDELIKQLETRTHYFLQNNTTEDFDTKIKNTYEENIARIDQELKAIETAHHQDQRALSNKINLFEQNKRKELIDKYGLQDNENDTSQDNALKQLKIDIIRAEKTGNEKALERLMNDYQKLTKNTSNNKNQKKISEILTNSVYKYSKTIEKEKQQRKIDYLKDTYAIRLKKELENIKYNTSTVLFKLEDDQEALKNDEKITNDIVQSIFDKLDTLKKFVTDLLKELFTYQKSTLNFEKKALTLENERLRSFDAFKQLVKQHEVKTLSVLNQNTFDLNAIQYFHQAHTSKVLQSLKHFHAYNKLQKQKLDHIHTSDILMLKEQQKAEQERLFQESLIQIAEKEFELQSMKLRNLYDHETSLINAQTERLESGLNVNKAMVETTVERQVNFAEQQIRFAESEYDARIEHIEEALSQEIDYAKEKQDKVIDSYEQKIFATKNTFKQRLEALTYKKALFTDLKSQKNIEQQINELKQEQETLIAKIENDQLNDPIFKRYQHQINLAQKRAETARNDAEEIKQQTIDSFSDLREQSETKLKSIQDAQSETRLLPHLDQEGESLAKKRLDEGIEEAKAFYEEKIQAPLLALKRIDDKINALNKGDEYDSKLTSINDQIDQLEHAYQATLDEGAQVFEENIKHNQEARKAFEEKAEKTLDVLNDKGIEKLIDHNTQSINTFYLQKEKSIDKHLEKEIHVIEARFTEHVARIKESELIIQESFKETLKAYAKYLTKATRSQKDAKKDAEKQSNVSLKKAIADFKKNSQI